MEKKFLKNSVLKCFEKQDMFVFLNEKRERVPLKIFYQLYFPRKSKVFTVKSSLQRVHSKEYYFMFTYTFLASF